MLGLVITTKILFWQALDFSLLPVPVISTELTGLIDQKGNGIENCFFYSLLPPHSHLRSLLPTPLESPLIPKYRYAPHGVLSAIMINTLSRMHLSSD